MATEVHQFSVTIPAGTPIDSPFTDELGQANYEIESVDVEVPPGPSGLVGFYIALDEQQWIPWEMGEYIIWDNRTESWQTEDQTVNSGWEITGYNLGQYDHTITVRFHTNPIPVATVDPNASNIYPTVTIISTPSEPDPVLL